MMMRYTCQHCIFKLNSPGLFTLSKENSQDKTPERERKKKKNFSCLISAFGDFFSLIFFIFFLSLPPTKHNRGTLVEILRWFRSEKCIAIKSLLILSAFRKETNFINLHPVNFLQQLLALTFLLFTP